MRLPHWLRLAYQEWRLGLLQKPSQQRAQVAFPFRRGGPAVRFSPSRLALISSPPQQDSVPSAILPATAPLPLLDSVPPAWLPHQCVSALVIMQVSKRALWIAP